MIILNNHHQQQFVMLNLFQHPIDIEMLYISP